MNFYPFHVGDYLLRTAHLEPLEDLAYRRLLDLYYVNEQPIGGTPAEVARIIRLRSAVAEVESVLREFFTETASGWQHSHCDEVIQQYQAKARVAAENGKRGGRPPKAKQPETKPEEPAPADPAKQNESKEEPGKTQSVNSANPAETGSKTNQEPRTNNQSKEPPLSPKGERAKRPAKFDPLGACPPNASTEAWAAYCDLRKAKRAPLTENACELIAKKLAEHPDPDAVLNLSTQNGWTGVFPEQVTSHAASQQNRGQGAVSAVDAVKQAQAERDAKAVAEASGHPLAQDGGTVWEEVDEGFRCVG